MVKMEKAPALATFILRAGDFDLRFHFSFKLWDKILPYFVQDIMIA